MRQNPRSYRLSGSAGRRWDGSASEEVVVGLDDDVVPRPRTRRWRVERPESGFVRFGLRLAEWQRQAKNIAMYPKNTVQRASECKLASLLEQSSSPCSFLIGGPRCEMKRTQWAACLPARRSHSLGQSCPPIRQGGSALFELTLMRSEVKRDRSQSEAVPCM